MLELTKWEKLNRQIHNLFHLGTHSGERLEYLNVGNFLVHEILFYAMQLFLKFYAWLYSLVTILNFIKLRSLFLLISEGQYNSLVNVKGFHWLIGQWNKRESPSTDS